MLDVIMSEYEDFKVYAPITEEPDMVYLEFPKEPYCDEYTWECCPVRNIINRADYDEPDDYHAAVDKLINEADGITCEFISNNYSIYIEVDNENAMYMTKEPQLRVVRYC